MAGVEAGRKLNLENISADEVLVNTNSTQAYVKAEVGEKIYKINNQPYVLIRFSDACVTTLKDSEVVIPRSVSAIGAALDQSAIVSASLSTPPPSQNNTGDSFNHKSTYVCGIIKEIEGKRVASAVDAASANRFRLSPGMVVPSAAVIPMKSNVFTYGPYPSNNFTSATGGCSVEQNTDLAPWVFGSSSIMNTAGYALANSGEMGLNQAESGSMTVIGLPSIESLGTIDNGPNLTNINVTFGASGVTTNYSFQTFTPKFGDLTKSAVEQMKNVARNRQKQLQFLRNQAIMSYNINRKLKRVTPKRISDSDKIKDDLAQGKTMHRCLVGEVYDWYEQSGNPSQRTVVGTESLAKTSLELRYDYDKKAFMSLDGFFAPISKKGDGNLPRYSQYDNANTGVTTTSGPSSAKTNAVPLAPHPPFSKGASGPMDQYNLTINQQYLDPLTNNVSSSNHHHDGDGAGHAVDLVGRNATPPDDGMIMNMLAKDDPDRYSEDYRFLGLKGPLVLHSWGYDLDGKPVPNLADVEAQTKTGQFTKQGLKDKFLKDWLNKPKTWPVAPVDLRFDRERGMWVSPQPYKIVVAKITESVPAFGSGYGILINSSNSGSYYKDLYDSDGSAVSSDGSSSGNSTQQHKWVLISATPCSSSLGACCATIFSNGAGLSCQDNITQSYCESNNGTFYPGQSCSSIQCGDTPPTSCNISDACIDEIYNKIWDRIIANTVSCDGSTSTTSAPATTTSTPTTTPPPATTTTTTVAPTSTTSAPTTTGQPGIKIVDRIGKSHAAGDMVYAYYDTYKSEYLVLDKYPEGSSPTIYGAWNGSSITVEGIAGSAGDINIGSSVSVENALNLASPVSGCDAKGVAVRFVAN